MQARAQIYIYIYRVTQKNTEPIYFCKSNMGSVYLGSPYIYILLWPVKGQKEDTEEEKVGRTCVRNKQNIYTK